VGTKHDARGGLGVIARDDVGGLEYRAVVALEVGFLRGHGTTILFELADDPLETALMALGIHVARTKITLCLGKGVCRIGIELWADRLQFFHLVAFVEGI